MQELQVWQIMELLLLRMLFRNNGILQNMLLQ